MKLKINYEKLLSNFKTDKKTLLFSIIGIILILIIFISEMLPTNEGTENFNSEEKDISYCDLLEQEVQEIVSSIDGAGKTKVMITLSETSEYIYAKNESNQNKTSDNSLNTDTENDYVIIEQNNEDAGLLVKTIEPKVRGVAIVCEGGDNPFVQQNIYSTVSAVLNISTARISISKLSNSEEKYEK